MNTNSRPGCTGRVIADYQATYLDPLTIQSGEALTLGKTDPEWPGWIWCTNRDGQSGWVPESYLERHGQKGIARYDYTAAELSVQANEELILHQFESGWYWATNQDGQSGWVPASHIEP